MSKNDDDDVNNRVEKILEGIEKKLLCSEALNGGFDRLMTKVEAIEASQDEIAKKVDDLHEVVYNPDDGLYARIKNIEHKNSIEAVEIGRQLDEIRTIKVSINDKQAAHDNSYAEQHKLMKATLSQIDDLVKWKDAAAKFMKWVTTSSVAGVALKLLYTLVSTLIFK